MSQEVVKSYLEQKQSLVRDFKEKAPELNIWNYLCCDTSCKFNFGKIRTQFICESCQNLRKITLVNPKLEKFKFEGNKYTIHRSSHKSTFYHYDLPPNFKARRLLEPQFVGCCPQVRDAPIYIQTDPFTAQVMTDLLLEDVKKDQLPLSESLTAFICGDTQYYIKKHHKAVTELISPGSQFHEDDVHNLIGQILIHYRILNPYNFTLGTPDYRALKIKLEPYSYKELRSEFTLILDTTPFTCLTVNNHRVYGSNVKIAKNLARLQFNYKIETIEVLENYDLANPKLAYTYILTPENSDIYLAIRRSGVPLFNDSFDLYCLFYSLMTYKPFYSAIKDLDYKVWKRLWLPEQFEKVTEKVEKYHDREPAVMEEIVKDLWGFNLYCDLLGRLEDLK